ncbi:MAG: nucleotidyltransferase family protein [Actinobacteria bacterium]|nr:nucleotidyltransferase family protein [Actinomycetota bacterium]
MRAILLAAGLGTRLRPLTDTIPKCLVPINGKPLLDIWCESLLAAGATKLLINLHYKSEVVQSHLAKSKFAQQTETVFEPRLLGTAGTLRANKHFFEGQDGILLHADNYCEADITELVGAHSKRPTNCDLTMLAFRTQTPQTCGILEIDNKNILSNMYEKSPDDHGNLANAAFYIVSKKLISELHDEADFSNEVIPKYFGKALVVETRETFIDIGTPETYALAQRVAKIR